MSTTAKTVAHLASRRVIEKFSGGGGKSMVRVTCLMRDEIVALVESLRPWKAKMGAGGVHVAVTVQEPWFELEDRDMVPRGNTTPTILRNQTGVGVVLIEGDSYTDKQSWTNVLPISDANLLVTENSRAELIRFLLARTVPQLLVEVLEQVYEATTPQGEEHVDVRSWVALVGAVCSAVGDTEVIHAASAWSAVGAALHEAKLFPDDALAGLSQIDLKRRLRRNCADSHRLIYEADDTWRDSLQDRTRGIQFTDVDGHPEPKQGAIREGVEEVLGAGGDAAQRNLLFRHWLQVVDSKKVQRGLGSTVHEHLVQEFPERIAEYEQLGVADGIDAGNEDDAQALLDEVPEEVSVPPIVSLLPKRQVTALERMANPRAPLTTTPLAEILRVASAMIGDRAAISDRPDDSTSARLVIDTRKTTDETIHSRSLFAWLFGPALAETAKLLDGNSLSLEIASDLLDTEQLKNFEVDLAEGEDDEDAGKFGRLELRLYWSDDSGLERRIDWSPADTPGLVALWRLAGKPEAVSWRPSSRVGFDSWLESALRRSSMNGALLAAPDLPKIVEQWYDARTEALQAILTEGLRPTLLRDYVDSYTATLEELRTGYVPMGAARAEVAGVIETDLFVTDGWAAVLATHPIRLRWIASYLQNLSDLMRRAFEGELATNPVNPNLFFDRILDVSPQAQPPVAVIGDKLFVAVREQGWHERLAPLKDQRGERRDWLADLDDGAIDDVGDTIARYLEAYPHKADGLHVLYIVRRHGARGLQRLVKNVLGRIKIKGASFILTLFVDADEVRAVEEVLQDFDDPDHRAHSARPPVQVTLHRWENPEEGLPKVDNLAPQVDIAVIPNLFGASTRTQDGTRNGQLEGGTFDPLFDEPTRLEAVGSGDRPSAAVSRVLLPVGRDALLESWSTLTTRQFRGTPVGDTPSDEDIDHVTIQVSLEKNREFFDALHECSHWVVTVDAFVGREQVEALDNGPDVVRVKTGVGANGAYRMVVSSKAGRRFVESRLERRLREQVLASAMADPAALATSIYDRARLLVPGIVLRSLGLGRTAAEMVGLVIARARVEESDPAAVGPSGFQSWLSLDEHPGWSGGHTKTRADLARLRGWMEGNTLHLIVDVVEAKMRTQVSIGRADGQLKRSVELLDAALRSVNDDGVSYADSRLWRRLIWRAIEQTPAAADATPAATHVLHKGEPRAGLDDLIRTCLREGEIVVHSISGVLVSMTDDEEGSDTETPAGHRWLRMTVGEVRDELQRLSRNAVYPLVARDVCEDPDRQMQEPAAALRVGSGSRAAEVAPQVAQRSQRGGASPAAKSRMQDLLDALHKRSVDASPEGGTDDAMEGPGFFVLRIQLTGNARPATVSSMAEDLQYLLGLDAGQLPRIYVDSGAIVVEVPKREGERYYISAQDLWARTSWPPASLYAPIGADVRDNPVGIDFSSSRSPHLLIGGMTGGGKSVALEALLVGLVTHYESDRLELRIIDPKGNEFTQFEGLSHVPEPPGMDAEDAIAMLESTCGEMDDRYRAMKELSRARKERVKDIASYNRLVDPAKRLKWILVVLDEFADLTSDRDHKKTIEGLLQRIAQKARACGIHAIVATQKPSAEVISTTTRSNLGAQLALRVRSSTDSRVIMESNGAESLAGNGDGFLRLSGEEPIRIQCAKVD